VRTYGNQYTREKQGNVKMNLTGQDAI